MQKHNSIIHEITFGKYRQEWELSFEHSPEEIDMVKIVAHNYNDKKFISSNDITSILPDDFIDAMVMSVDLSPEITAQDIEWDMFEQIADATKPSYVHPIMANTLKAFGME